MRRLESIEDEMHGVVTIEFPSGERVRVARKAYDELGIVGVARYMGTNPPTERERVFQDGQCIGTVPPGFDPLRIKSTSFLYDPRPGDFVRDGENWIAQRNLGGGDFECIPGFVWERDSGSRAEP